MYIDRELINRTHWFEDDEGNIYSEQNEKTTLYKSRFPLEVNENIYIVGNKNVFNQCQHPFESLSITFNKNSDGCLRIMIKCLECQGELEMHIDKLSDWSLPTFNKLITGSTHISGVSDLIVKMVNSGEYTLNEAFSIASIACERCINVLSHKYDCESDKGYAEYSDEWYKANTVCDFCRNKPEPVHNPIHKKESLWNKFIDFINN